MPKQSVLINTIKKIKTRNIRNHLSILTEISRKLKLARNKTRRKIQPKEKGRKRGIPEGN